MFLESVCMFLISVVTGVLLFVKITGDIFPFGLKRALNKLALSNWVKRVPQVLPVYEPFSGKSPKEVGILTQDAEWELEKPKKIQRPGEIDDLTFYGIDDKGNCVFAKMSRHWGNVVQVSIALRRNGEMFMVKLEGIVQSENEFSFGNFKLEMIQPFRVWRLFYNGYMERCDSKEVDSDLVHVTINFLWKPLENAKDFRKDANISLLANSLDGKFGESFPDLNKTIPFGYYQFGTMHGVVKVNEDNVKDDTLYLYGYRCRKHLSQIRENGNNTELFAMKDLNGDAIRLISSNEIWIDGEGNYGSMNSYPIQEVDVEPSGFNGNNSMIPKLIDVIDSASSHRVEIWSKVETFVIKDSLQVILLKLDINGKTAHGILLRESNNYFSLDKQFGFINPTFPANQVTLDRVGESNDDLVTLDSKNCFDVALVGGKGASLAKLAFMSRQISEVKTARGFCVTTKLFGKLIDEKKLEDIFNQKDVELEKLCAEAMKCVEKSSASESLRPLVASYIEKVFGENATNLRFAVRSSGVLEDGTELSCAGQNETFLGIDRNSIPDKIVQCWASLFTPLSVSYRRNHGQPLISQMGVVVQEMIVDPLSAGVLFTANPTTGNPFEMLVTCNFGLGESVVSGNCDPDSIIVLRQRSKCSLNSADKANFSIGEATIGDKKTKIVMGQTGNTREEILSEEDSSRLCISESAVLQLCVIASKIEKEIGQFKPVDVEWAISQAGEIVVLQCRAMTSLDAWTDFEIMHQFDTAIRTKIDIFTTANTGEVMPKPMHAVSIQSLNRNLDIGIQAKTSIISNTPACCVMSRCCPIYNNRLFLSVYPSLYRRVGKEIDVSVSCIDLPVFGRPVITKEVHQIAVERYGVMNFRQKMNGLIHAFQLVRGASAVVSEANALYANWTFNAKGKPTSRTIYNQISHNLMDIRKISDQHCEMSEASSTTLVFAFIALAEGKNAEDWPSSIYEDAGKLLSAYASVESAEMPTDMENFVEAIIKYGQDLESEFLGKKSTKDSIAWIQSNEELTKVYQNFIKKHGHRSIAELDIGQDSWSTDPTELLMLLKSLVKNRLKGSKKAQVVDTEFKDEEELLQSLKTPVSNGTKKFLKFILPHCRRMVMYRERTKSLLVRILGQMKEAYGLLAEFMVNDNLIPDKGLIKHLSHEEMGLLIDKHFSSPSIIYRAMRRVRLYPVQEAIEYEEINTGIPQPVKDTNSVDFGTLDVIKGTPVSAGKIRGTAKVCLNVDEASEQIEEGDILITKATDIAWSPFFPMLGGVVTELGGLISHGAVVAREYKLPCIVGAVNATKIFKSGDEIILDTAFGTVTKIAK